MAQRSSSSDATSRVPAEQVRELTVSQLAAILPLGVAGYRFTDADIYNLLVVAGAEQRSLECVARQFVAAPSANLVRHYLGERLLWPLAVDELEARCNDLLVARLPPGLVGRRHRGHRVAIDLTLLPYYGQYADEPGEVRRGPAKAGTTRFHAYGTAYVIRSGRRVTLAVAFVYAEDALLDVLEELLNRVDYLGIGVHRLYLDREFASVAILRWLAGQPFTSIVPVPKRGKTLPALLHGPRSLRTTYTMTSAEDGELTFPLLVAVRYAMGRRDRHGREYLPFAVVGQAHGELTVRQVAQEYRERFGIEASYRLMHQALARTTARDPGLRLLLVTIGLLLTNLWVWLKATLLASTPRTERAAARAWLHAMVRLDRFRDYLIEAIKARYQVHTVLAYPFPLASGFSL